MLYLVNLKHASIAKRFQMAMLVSGWMRFYLNMNHYNLTSLELKMRAR